LNSQSEVNKQKENYKSKEKRSMMFWGWGLIAPTLIGLLVLNIIPMIQTFVMSFQNVSTLVNLPGSI
jgi:hypothetical protein